MRRECNVIKERMGFLPEVELHTEFAPFVFLRENFGFIPNLFHAQTRLERVIEGQLPIYRAILRDGALWGNFLCTLSGGLGVEPDFVPPALPGPEAIQRRKPPHLQRRRTGYERRPYLRTVEVEPGSFPPLASAREKLGFIPNLFLAPTLRLDFIEAEFSAAEQLVLTGDVLSRLQKEYVLLRVSAANLNTYCVAAHCEILRGLGVSTPEAEQIAVDHHQADLSNADKTLLDVSLKLAKTPLEYGAGDVDALRKHGFTDQQILEGVAVVAYTNFLNTLDTGLGVVPDFETGHVWTPKEPQPLAGGEPAVRAPTQHTPIAREAEDPDTPLIGRVQSGDSEAFEELVRRHTRRIYSRWRDSWKGVARSKMPCRIPS